MTRIIEIVKRDGSIVSFPTSEVASMEYTKYAGKPKCAKIYLYDRQGHVLGDTILVLTENVGDYLDKSAKLYVGIRNFAYFQLNQVNDTLVDATRIMRISLQADGDITVEFK